MSWRLSVNWTFSLWCVPLIKSVSLIHKNIRSVCYSHVPVYRSIWRKAHYGMTHKTITSVLKVSTDIITNIPARHIGLAEILATMSVLTFKIAVILFYIFNNISVMSWLLVLLVGESEVPLEHHRPAEIRWQTFSQNVESSTPHHERDSNSQRYWW